MRCDQNNITSPELFTTIKHFSKIYQKPTTIRNKVENVKDVL